PRVAGGPPWRPQGGGGRRRRPRGRDAGGLGAGRVPVVALVGGGQAVEDALGGHGPQTIRTGARIRRAYVLASLSATSACEGRQNEERPERRRLLALHSVQPAVRGPPLDDEPGGRGVERGDHDLGDVGDEHRPVR